MTFNEYNDLMGYDKPCEFEEYKEADAIYMMLDMDKHTFCAHYADMKDNLILLHLAAEVQSLKHRSETAFEVTPKSWTG